MVEETVMYRIPKLPLNLYIFLSATDTLCFGRERFHVNVKTVQTSEIFISKCKKIYSSVSYACGECLYCVFDRNAL